MQDCNVRCVYCASDHGRYGQQAKVVSEEVLSRLEEFILETSPTGEGISIELGGGESLLFPERVFPFVRSLDRRLNSSSGSRVKLTVTTNGTQRDEAIYQKLADLGATVVFSIDGPQDIHDINRPDVNGQGTHERAMKSLRTFKMMTDRDGQPAKWKVASVISSASSLARVASFWAQQDVAVFSDLVENPRFGESPDSETIRLRQEAYLQDLTLIAGKQAARLTVETFEIDYRGPGSILEMWKMLSWGRRGNTCGAGYSAIGVDACGQLYPCSEFTGFERFVLGNIVDGIDYQRVEEFRQERKQAEQKCQDCLVRFACVGGCLAADPDTGVVTNFRQGCDFQTRLIEMMVQTHEILAEN